MSEQAVETTEVVAPTQAEQETASALSAGYNKVRGDVDAPKAEQEPVAEAKPEEKQDEKQEPVKEEAAQAADPWEGVPPIVKQEFDRLRVTANQVGPAQRHIKALEDQIAELRAAGEAAKAAAPGTAPTVGQIQAAATSGEKWKAIKEDFPEWAEAMEERLAAQAAPPSQAPVDVEKLRKEWQEGTQAQVAGAIDVAEERAFVRFKYPGWKETVRTPEFQTWMQTQAPEVQALAQSSLADDAIRMLDGFTEHQKAAAVKAAAEAKNKQRLAAAVAPKQAASGGPTILPDEAGIRAGYERVAKRRFA